MASTGDYFDDFAELGFDREDSQRLAHDYLASGSAAEGYDSYRSPGEFAAEEMEAEFGPGADVGLIDYDIDNTPDFDTGFSVGCDFKGIKVILEKDNERIYIPDSYYCLLKCYNKFFEITGSDLRLDLDDISPYGSSIVKVKDKLKAIGNRCLCPQKHSTMCNKITCNCKKAHTLECKRKTKSFMNNLPKMYRYVVKKGVLSLLQLDSHHKPTNYNILLIPFGGSEYHAVLAKIPAKDITKDDGKLEFGRSTKIVCDFVKLKKTSIKPPIPFIYCYDIETYTTYPKPDKALLIPYALSYNRVDLVNGSWSEPILIRVSVENPEINIFDEMVKQITEFENEKYANNKQYEIQIYAHNGGGFDNIYAKSMKTVEFVDQIAKGSKIKSMSVKINSRKLVFKDSLPFTLSSLAVAGKMFGATERKMEGFDIVGKDKLWYDSTVDWIPYLLQDVRALASLMVKVEEYMREFGESVTYNVGLPSVTWRVLNKTCYGMRHQYVPKDPTVIELIKDSNIGGRVLHWKKEINVSKGDEPYICYDANSLYPSAMFSSSFPYGKPKLMEDFTSFTDGTWQKVFTHCIVVATIQPPNIRYPFHPYRNDKGSILYIVEKFTGTYNDVDLKEMEKDGYKIVSVSQGIYWTKSARIFSDLIYTLYQKRREVGGDSPMGYFLKIFLNSMYGKLFEKIDSVSFFTRDKELADKYSNVKILPGGTYEVSERLIHSMVRKPLQLASYVLANSRKIMNEIIRNVGPENIAYGDTDSLYIAKSAAAKVASFANNDLCGFKNDYGDGLWVTRAIFLDIKRYYLKFNKEVGKGCDVKTKFNGLNFRDKTRISNYKCLNDYNRAVEALYEDLKSAPDNGVTVIQEKFIRCGLNVVICEKTLKFQVLTTRRADWEGNEFYPIGYRKDIPEYKIVPTETIGTHVQSMMDHKSLDYSVKKDFVTGVITLDSCLPLRYVNKDRLKVESMMTPQESNLRKEERKNLPKEIKPSKAFQYCTYLRTSYVLYKGKMYYCIDTSLRLEGKVKTIKEYFDMCPLGPYKKTEDKIDTAQTQLIVYVKDYSGPAAELTQEDYQLLLGYKTKAATDHQSQRLRCLALNKAREVKVDEGLLVDIPQENTINMDNIPEVLKNNNNIPLSVQQINNLMD